MKKDIILITTQDNGKPFPAEHSKGLKEKIEQKNNAMKKSILEIGLRNIERVIGK